MAKRGSQRDKKQHKKPKHKVYGNPAERQARWRKNHPEKYEAFKERLRMQTLIGRGERVSGDYFVWEIVNECGEIIDVVIRRHYKGPPAGAQRSEWLPHTRLNYWLARALRDARIAQLKAWRDSQ